MDVRPSGVVGVFLCSTPEACCLCDEPIELNAFAKQIGRRHAHLKCADRALEWVLAKRIAKKISIEEAAVDAD